MAKFFIIATPILIIVGLLAVLVLIMAPAGQRPCSVAAASSVDPDQLAVQQVYDYGPAQLRNAALIMNAAQARGLNHDAQVIGVMAALGESGLTLGTYDDPSTAPDERGLFAQPSTGWGTLADRLDPTISATNFFIALEAVPGWETLYPSVAVHRVTGNADPYGYSAFQLDAYAIISGISGQNGGCLAGDLVLPLDVGYGMTSDFGPRVAPATWIDSTWHPADDLQNTSRPCGDPIYAITAGTVTVASGYQISVKHLDGYTVSYLHMYPDDMLVDVGDDVEANQQIASTGDNGPATGCHLDLRINLVGNTNTALSTLTLSEALGGTAYPGFVDPEAFYALFGLELCPTETCARYYR